MTKGTMLGVLLTVGYAFVAIADDAAEMDTVKWREDLAFLAEHIKATHLKAFHTVSEEDFDIAVAVLNERIPTLSDGEIALELQRITAMIGDGHTWLSHRLLPYVRKYPLAARWFDDGIYVVYAMPPYEFLAGARIVQIGDASPEAVLEAAEPYVSRDNEWTVKERISGLTTRPEFLHMKGFVDDMAYAPFTFESRGAKITQVMQPVSLEKYAAWAEARSEDEDIPLYRTDGHLAYWKTYLEDHDAVYAKFNAVRNQDGGPHLAGFAREVIELVDEKRADYLIIDARNNGGGSGDILKPLIRRISQSKRINRKNRLFVITSRQTFSAALMFIMRMDRETEAIFVGEPSGGKPNSYGEYDAFTLPHSKMDGSISTRYHQEGEPDDTREYLPVDIPVSLTGKDYLAGHDPVLEAIFARIK